MNEVRATIRLPPEPDGMDCPCDRDNERSADRSPSLPGSQARVRTREREAHTGASGTLQACRLPSCPQVSLPHAPQRGLLSSSASFRV